jgi:hypothetical protein
VWKIGIPEAEDIQIHSGVWLKETRPRKSVTRSRQNRGKGLIGMTEGTSLMGAAILAPALSQPRARPLLLRSPGPSSGRQKLRPEDAGGQLPLQRSGA